MRRLPVAWITTPGGGRVIIMALLFIRGLFKMNLFIVKRNSEADAVASPRRQRDARAEQTVWFLLMSAEMSAANRSCWKFSAMLSGQLLRAGGGDDRDSKQGLILPRFGCCRQGARSLIKATSVYCRGIKFNFIISRWELLLWQPTMPVLWNYAPLLFWAAVFLCFETTNATFRSQVEG